MHFRKQWRCAAISAGVLLALPGTALAQPDPQIDFESVGRGAPVVDADESYLVGATMRPVIGTSGSGPFGEQRFTGSAGPGEMPAGIEPLERDIFTSDDFYADRELWTDPRYYRCNSPGALEELWGGNRSSLIGDNPPASAAWGNCDRDYPRDAIVSPYGFETAEAHYQALLTETEARGGPTEHSYATVPGEWTGQYAHPGFTPGNAHWYRMRFNQVPTILSLLTPEYQERFVQESYHHAHTNAPQWPSQYCWPEGLMRRWHWAAQWEVNVMVTPDMVQFLGGVARNFITNIHIGQEFNMEGAVPRIGEDVPRWYGETIGFWDNDTLITWTSNVQGWKGHAIPEWSNQLQSIEIYSPYHDEAGNFIGINHEAIFYDREALVEPIRVIRNYVKQNNFDQATPYVYVECNQSIFPIDGLATPVSPGDVIEYEVPDMYGRPWAEIWENYHEQHMDRPEEEDIFSFD